MATSVDMSLDDLIKSNRERIRGRGRGGGGRGRGRGRGHGPSGYLRGERMTRPVRRGPLAVNARPSSYMIAKPARRTRSFPWQHDLFEDSLRAAGISGVEVGTKLNVSNLDSGVSNEDIRELFAEIGDLERYAIHYDKNGRPGGSAEVVYTRRSDAFAALKRYNNVLLDGKPMKLEVVGANVEIPVSARVNVTGENGRRKRTVVMTPGAGLNGGGSSINRGSGSQNRRWAMRNGHGRGAMGNDRGFGAMGNGRGHGAMGNGRGHGAMGNGRGRGRGAARGWGHGRVRGRGRGRKQPVDQSADDLNDDLEKYHAEAMQT